MIYRIDWTISILTHDIIRVSRENISACYICGLYHGFVEMENQIEGFQSGISEEDSTLSQFMNTLESEFELKVLMLMKFSMILH
jgi:hypothetical protein